MLRRNIEALLSQRRETASELARSVGKSKYWISKFLTGERNELQIEDIDRIAAFFGIAPFQLIQPGINTLTERRSGIERRKGVDRRVGHTGRLLAGLQVQLNKSPRHAALTIGGPHVPAAVSELPGEVQAILAEAERRIAAVYERLGEQNATAGVGSAKQAKGRRSVRGSTPQTA